MKESAFRDANQTPIKQDAMTSDIEKPQNQTAEKSTPQQHISQLEIQSNESASVENEIKFDGRIDSDQDADSDSLILDKSDSDANQEVNQIDQKEELLFYYEHLYRRGKQREKIQFETRVS